MSTLSLLHSIGGLTPSCSLCVLNSYGYGYAQTLNSKRHQLYSVLCPSVPIFEADSYRDLVAFISGEIQ